MDKGAVDDIKQLEEEVSRPDSIIQVNQGKKLEIIESRPWLRLMYVSGKKMKPICSKRQV